MNQNFRYVDHVEGSKVLLATRASARIVNGGSLLACEGLTPTPRGRAPLGEFRDRVEELRDRKPLSWGNYVIADTYTGSSDRTPGCSDSGS